MQGPYAWLLPRPSRRSTPPHAGYLAVLSEETLERARASFEAFNRGDYESWIAGFSGDVEIHDLADSPEGGAFRGHAGLRSWLAQMHDAWGDSLRLEPVRFIDGDDRVLAEVKATGVGASSGVPIELTVYFVTQLRDDKVVWSRTFLDRAEAVAASGLSG